MSDLPASLAAHTAAFMAAEGLDYRSPEAMRGQCETQSYRLARYLVKAGIEADPVVVDLGVPGNDMAAMHFVVLARPVDERGDSLGLWRIDLTAAQFRAEMGWNGPQAEETF